MELVICPFIWQNDVKASEGIIMNYDEIRIQILLVDDSVRYCSSLAGLLQDNGFMVATALDTETAILRIEEMTGPMVVFLDRWLVDKKGNQVLGENLLHQLKDRARFPILFILHSNDTSESAEKLAIRAGADWSLPKGSDLIIDYAWRAVDRAKALTGLSIDGLTDALNRNAMIDRVTRELSRAERNETSTACIFFDLDKLKRVNDTYGHATGNIFILHVMKNIRRYCLRPTDVICRNGGDEIVVFLFDVAEHVAHKIAGQVCQCVSDQQIATHTNAPEKGSIRVSVSAGVAMLYPSDIKKVKKEITSMSSSGQGSFFKDLLESLIADADRKMYHRKNLNANR